VPRLLAAAASTTRGVFSSSLTAPLQRTFGNRAVQRLFAANPVAVQRAPTVLNQEGEEEDAADWSEREIELWMEWYGLLSAREQKTYEPSFRALSPLAERVAADKRTFEELGAAAARQVRRDPIRILNAKRQVRDWLAATRSLDRPPVAFWAVNGNEQTIAAHLTSIVDDPFHLNHDDYPICGANAFLHSLAV